jgi:hypothetical protein
LRTRLLPVANTALKTLPLVAAAPPRLPPAGLLDKLSGERGRWASQLSSLASGLAALPLEALLAAAGVVHLSGQPEDVRAAVSAEWAR